QARGLNEAFMITEQILPMFRPSYTVAVKEYPLFDDMTETQLQIEDPSFDIIEEYEDTDVNIVNITAALTIRGNLYMPLAITAPVKTFKMFTHLWDTYDIKESQKASYYDFDVCDKDGQVFRDNIEEHYAPPKLTKESPIEEDSDSPCKDYPEDYPKN
ncbi:MAG: hypothetical protein DRP93_06810, partial [Candidatus Neomarinimicrobiota bacterium]